MDDPIYREAYPRLDIIQAKLSNRASTNMELDRRVCRFWSRGGCPGDLVVPERADHSIVIDFKFLGRKLPLAEHLILVSSSMGDCGFRRPRLKQQYAYQPGAALRKSG